MSEGGAIPGVFGRVHHRYRTPYIAIIVFSSIAMGIVVAFSAQLGVLAEMYNFGALLAYMIVGLSLIVLRNREKNLFRPFRTPWSIRINRRTAAGSTQYEVPVLALGCFVADLTIWLLVVILHPIGREVGTAWIVLGLLLFYLYSRVKRRKGTPGTTIEFPSDARTPS